MICIIHSLIVPIVFISELSISVKTLQYDLKKSDITKSCNRKLFFDTHAMVQLLEESGEISCLCFCNALANSSSVIHQNVLCPFRFRDSAGRGHCQYDGKCYKFKHGRYVRWHGYQNAAGEIFNVIPCFSDCLSGPCPVPTLTDLANVRCYFVYATSD